MESKVTQIDQAVENVTNGVQPFKHQPLDHSKASIRLLQISLQDSASGTIQCSMRHDTIQPNSYFCLSYRWGDDIADNRILINGEEMYVRKNLYNFLEMAAKHKYIAGSTQHWFWIDALCIDQDNVTERNHQVQQMGSIYRNAKTVYLWLGKATNVPNLSNYFFLLESTTTYAVASRRRMSMHLYVNDYWRRAWITQEIILARRVLVLVNNDYVPLKTLINKFPHRRSEIYDISDIPFLPFATNAGNIMGKSLVVLLLRFKDRHCHIPRDRIFSLLSVCGTGSKLNVDYSVLAEELMLQTLQECRDRFCLCTAAAIARSLDLHADLPLADYRPSSGTTSVRMQYWIEFEVIAHRTGRGPKHVLHSHRPRYRNGGTRNIEYGDNPFNKEVGIALNIFSSCPVHKDFRITWHQPVAIGECQTIWYENASIRCFKDVRSLCTYGDGFEVRNLDGTPYLGMDDLNADSDAEHLGAPKKERPNDICPQRYNKRDISILTIRVTFGVFAKFMQYSEEFCTHQGFKVGTGLSVTAGKNDQSLVEKGRH